MGFYGDLMVLNGDYIIFMWIIWLVVTGTMESYDFPFSWECHHPNWLIFFRGVETTNQIIVWSGNYFSILFYPFLGVTRSIWNLFVDQRRSVCCKFTEGKILGIWSQLFWDRSHKNFRVWWVESYIYIYHIYIQYSLTYYGTFNKLAWNWRSWGLVHVGPVFLLTRIDHLVVDMDMVIKNILYLIPLIVWHIYVDRAI